MRLSIYIKIIKEEEKKNGNSYDDILVNKKEKDETNKRTENKNNKRNRVFSDFFV